MRVLLLLAALLLAGCAASDILPSLRYCEDVSYVRVGVDVEVHAKCRVPAG